MTTGDGFDVCIAAGHDDIANMDTLTKQLRAIYIEEAVVLLRRKIGSYSLHPLSKTTKGQEYIQALRRIRSEFEDHIIGLLL